MPVLATIASLAALGSTVMGSGASFAQARKQRMLQQDAQRKAEEALAAARKRLEVNVYEREAIAKEPYELQREALLRSGAQAMEAARESERGAAAAAGRLQSTMAGEQATTRAEMATDIQGMRGRIIAEDARLRDEGMAINKDIVAGAQQAIADAQEARNAAIVQGIQGLGAAANQLYENAPLYMKDAQSRNIAQATKTAGGAEQIQQMAAYPGAPYARQFSGVSEQFTADQRAKIAQMSPVEFQEYLQQTLNTEQARALNAGVSGAYAVPRPQPTYDVNRFTQLPAAVIQGYTPGASFGNYLFTGTNP
jgi:hypothetical protein